MLSAEEVRSVVPSGDHWAVLKWLLGGGVWEVWEGLGVDCGVWLKSVLSLMAVSAMLPWYRSPVLPTSRGWEGWVSSATDVISGVSGPALMEGLISGPPRVGGAQHVCNLRSWV